MESSTVKIEDWKKEFTRFEEDDYFPLYEGSVIMGGVVEEKEDVKKYLRKRFCNEKLFSGKGEEKVISSEDFKTKEKYSLLSKLTFLVGSQRRDEFEPILLKAINTFASTLSSTNEDGAHLCVESPFFSCVAFCFPCSDDKKSEKMFSYIGYCQWACGVC